jgi:hypothetical protein
MKHVQILLPLRDNRGRPFKRSLHERIRKEITDELGGLTAYTRSPARRLEVLIVRMQDMALV